MSIEVVSNEPNFKPESLEEKPSDVKVDEKAESAPDSESEQKEPLESDPKESEETEPSEEDQEDQVDESDKDKPTDQESEKPKKKGGFQKRIDKLNTRLSASQQEIEYWKQQALKGQASPASGVKIDPAPKVSEGKPDSNNFESFAEYNEALIEWKAEQKFKEREAIEAQKKIQDEYSNSIKTYQERVKAFSEKTRDFNEVLAEVDDIPASPIIQQLLVASENGPQIVYELAKNRDEFERINGLPPLMIARELGKIESRVTLKTSESQKVETKKITSAPKPLEPVGKSGKGSAPKSIFDSNLSQAEYEALRAEQQKRRRA